MIQQKEKARRQPCLKSHQNNKIPEINLTKEVKNLNFENCETLMKETEGDMKKWKDVLFSWIRISIFNAYI